MNFRLLVGPKGTLTLADLKPGAWVNVAVTYERKQRSGRQNRYYWGVVIPAFLGDHRFKKFSKDQMHDALKVKLLSHIDPTTGMLIVGSTTENDTLEQEQYHERVRLYAAEVWDIDVPEPNE